MINYHRRMFLPLWGIIKLINKYHDMNLNMNLNMNVNMNEQTALIGSLRKSRNRSWIIIGRSYVMILLIMSWIIALLRILVGGAINDDLQPSNFSVWPVCYFESDLGFLGQFIIWIIVRAVSAPYLRGTLKEAFDWCGYLKPHTSLKLRDYYGMLIANLFQFLFFLVLNTSLLTSTGHQVISQCGKAIGLEIGMFCCRSE